MIASREIQRGLKIIGFTVLLRDYTLYFNIAQTVIYYIMNQGGPKVHYAVNFDMVAGCQ